LAKEVGDEPLMLAIGTDGETLPVWIARDRIEGARAAARAGAEIVVLDDAHQNTALAKSLSLVVVDGETRNEEWPFGDGAVFPSGPMREPLRAGLARADVVVILLPTDVETADPELVSVFGDLPVFVARLTADGPPPAGPQVGFAGVAKPWKVERSLLAAGCDLKDFAPFADHAALSEADLGFLADRAALFEAGLVTTEKDWVRLPRNWRSRVTPWPVRAVFQDEAAFADLLAGD
jgi:tetraacyldisaccharide 4'-kinase